MYHTRSKLLLGAVVVGPHAKIDLLATGFIFIIYRAMCGGGVIVCIANVHQCIISWTLNTIMMMVTWARILF